MKHIKHMTIAILTALVALPASMALAKNKVSEPFNYSGYTFPDYGGYDAFSQYVSMTDGTKLATAVYVPTKGPSVGAFPALFIYHPYHYKVTDPITGETKPTWTQSAMDFYLSYGYAIVNVDMRGSGGSYGIRSNFSEQLAEDGKEIVDWIADQPWCDGNVGMIGSSYMGWSQYSVAGRKPKALKCIIPEFCGFDQYTTVGQYPGGIRNRQGLFGTWGPVFFDLNVNWPSIPHTIAVPSSPIIDEDSDGEIADEIPLDLNSNGSFIDDYQLPDHPPQYTDGEKRAHAYYLMTLEHLANPVLVDEEMGFRDGQVVTDSPKTFNKFGPNDYPINIAETHIPIYNIGGWFDRFVGGTTQWYATLQKKNPCRMLIAPAIHNWAGFIENSYGPYVEHFGMNTPALIQGFHFERLRFLDHYLKGVKNKIDKEDPVLIYVMNGEGWRSEKEWPPKRTKITDVYFDHGNSLSARISSEGADAYTADFTHDSRQDSSNANRWGGSLTSVHTRNVEDAQCLTYTSGTLEKDVEVTGHPLVHFWVSSTADYGDFFVYLVDVDENGTAYHVTDGQHRAGFAKLVPNEDMLSAKKSGLDVLPDLPWHGYKKSDFTDGVFSNGNIVDVTFDLFPTSWVFKKDHQIRVSIACADYPTFDLHPKLAPNNNPNDPEKTASTIAIHRGEGYPSEIELPLIAPKHRIKFIK